MANAGSGLASGLAVLLGPPEPRKGTWYTDSHKDTHR